MLEIFHCNLFKIFLMLFLFLFFFWDPYNSNVGVFDIVPEVEEKKKVYEKVFEDIIVENFSNMEKEIVSQVQESHTG